MSRSSILTFQHFNILSAAFLCAFALAAPFLIIAPAYAYPPRLDTGASVPNPVHITFEVDGAQPELVGYDAARSVRVGEELPLTLYWRTNETMDADVYVYIHLFDAENKIVGEWEALPGNGLYPARLWQPGEVLVDKYRVPIRADAQGPIGRVEVGLARVGTTLPLVARDPRGAEITPNLARFKLASRAAPVAASPARFIFGDVFGLSQLDFYGKRGVTKFQILPPRVGALDTPLRGGDIIRASYTLVARRAPEEDYTVFVHLVDARGTIIAQYDAPPLGGAYPTSFWDAGEVVSDEFDLTIPPDAAPGDFALEFGLYRARDEARLTVAGESFGGLQAAGDYLLLAPIPLEK